MMNKIILTIYCVLMGMIICKAQEGFKVSGIIEGVPDGPLLLMSFENEKPDTLGFVRTQGGRFEFSGKVDGIVSAFVMTLDRKGVIPFILENADYTITVGRAGIQVKGGEMQELNNQFNALNDAVMVEEQKLKEDFMIAQQEGNNMRMQALQNQFGKILEKAMEEETVLLKKYADTYVAAYVVASGMQQMDYEQLKARYGILGENAKATAPGRSVAALLARQEKVAVGSVAPDFVLQTPRGDSITLKNVTGKLKLIDFWASWCGPCRQEMPNLIKIYQKYHPVGFEIIGISLDDSKQQWVRAIGEDGNTWLNGSDLKGQHSDVAREYFVRNIPHTLLLDENNVIIAKDLRGDALRKKVAELLKKK